MRAELRRWVLWLFGAVDAAEAAEASALEAHMSALGIAGEQRREIVDAARILASCGLGPAEIAAAIESWYRTGAPWRIVMVPVFEVSTGGVARRIYVEWC